MTSRAPIDVPPFDRANVDGFALRSADTVRRERHRAAPPRSQRRSDRLRACAGARGRRRAPPPRSRPAAWCRAAPTLWSWSSTRSWSRSGAAGDRSAPRGRARPIHLLCRLRYCARRGGAAAQGTRIGSREIGMLAACGIAEVEVVRRPQGGGALDRRRAGRARRRARARRGSMTATARSSPRRSRKRAASRFRSAPFPTMRRRSSLPMRTALEVCDMVVLSRRHLEGRGRPLAPRRVAARRARHPRAWRRAQAGQAALPRRDRRQAAGRAAGISDLGDLHLPCLRRAGDPRACRPAAGGGAHHRGATCRCASPPSSAARSSCWSRWSRASDGPVAFPTAKGSGSVTSFSQADGFLEIDALASALDAGTRARVTLIGQSAAMPDLVVMGSHCVALDVVLGALAERGLAARTHRGRQPGRRGGGRARRMRSCAGAPRRSRDRRLQRASAASPGSRW